MKETLTMKEANRLQVIQQCLDKIIKVENAAMLLNLTERQIYRLKAKLKEKGVNGIMHGNRGREPANKPIKEKKQEIVDLFKLKYFDFNFAHFTEQLEIKENIKVSPETTRLILWDHQEELKEADIILEKKKRPKHRSRRERMPKYGMLIQIDGSHHDWFKTGVKYTLLGLIDDATGEVDALFSFKETTLGYMNLIKKLFREKGLAMAFYADRHSCFKITRHGGMHVNQSDDNLTQIEKALEELGIELIPAGSPQAKGRIERLFKTFQDRLVSELRLENIKTITDANIFLQTKFIPDFNKRFAREPEEPESAFRPLPKEINLDRILSVKEERTVKADNTISFEGKIYQLLPNEYRISYAKAKIEVCRFIDNSLHAFLKGEELKIKEVDKETSKKKDLSLEEFVDTLKQTKLNQPDKIALVKPDKIALA